MHYSSCFHYCDFQLTEQFHRLSAPLPPDQFDGVASDVEPRLSAFLLSRSKVNSECSSVFSHCQELVKRLNDASESAKSAKSSVDYSAAKESIERRLGEARELEGKVKEVCLKREKRWNLSIQLCQLGPSVDQVLACLSALVWWRLLVQN